MSTDYVTDIVTREIVHSAVKATVDEMEFVIGRTSMSDGFRDKKDYFVGLFDPRGRMIHALTSYSGAGMVTPVLKHFPAETMRDGEIYFFNDPYLSEGAVQHLPDAVVVTPVFVEGVLVALAAGFGHVADVGATWGASVDGIRDVFAEGVAYPPMQIGRDHRIDDWFMRLFTRNSRYPTLVEGDLEALHAACRLAQSRLDGLLAKYGRVAFAETVDWSIERTTALVRSIIEEQIPDGDYESSQHVDVGSDGVTVHLVLRKHDGIVEADLSGSGDQVDGPWNYTCSLDGVRLLMALQLLVFDESISMNEGALQGIDRAIFRSGSVVQPKFPAPIHFRSQVKSGVSNALAEAIALANGGYMTAPQPTYVTCVFDFGREVGTFTETAGVGLGARPFADGPDVVYGPAQRNYPIEIVEPKHPVEVVRYEVRTDSCGAGLYRGGCGVVRELRVLRDCTVTPSMSNMVRQSPGVAGGSGGQFAELVIVRSGGEAETIQSTDSTITLRSGDVVSIRTAGGGGWGDPLQRDLTQVFDDVRDEFISEEFARLHYGLVLGADGQPDSTASEFERAALRAAATMPVGA